MDVTDSSKHDKDCKPSSSEESKNSGIEVIA